MAYSAEFRALCAAPSAEGMVPRITIRDKSGAVTVASAIEPVLAVGEIRREREKSFGVVQGNTWQARLANDRQLLLPLDLPDCWVALEAGFPEADVWELMAQGRIISAPASTDMTITLEVGDAVMDALDYVLTRDIFFGPVGWAGDITPVAVADSSAEYSNDVNASIGAQGVLVAPAYAHLVIDEAIRIVFTTASTYKVVYEDGSEATGFAIAADADFGPSTSPASPAFKVKAAGWSTEVGAYVVGDTYVFYASGGRTAGQLTTIGMVRHLLTDVAQLTAYNVLDDEPYSSPLYDAAGAWDEAAAAHASTRLGGYWPKGTRLIEMVQEALMLAHASIYAAPTGQIAISWLRPAGAQVATINGDPAAGTVTLLAGTATDTRDETYNLVTLDYLSLARGKPATARFEDGTSPFVGVRHLQLSTSWRVGAVTAADCVYKALSRFAGSRRLVSGETTLAHAVLDIDEIVAVTDTVIVLRNHLCGIVAVTLSIMEQRCTIEAYRDEVAAADYARVGSAKIGHPGLVW